MKKHKDLFPKPFPVGSWAKCKNNESIRYVSKHNGIRYFEDDGIKSKLPPSPYCYYRNYELFIAL